MNCTLICEVRHPAAKHRTSSHKHIPQIISLIERLLHRQFAYIAENGDVMFSTASAKGYGKLWTGHTMLRAGTASK